MNCSARLVGRVTLPALPLALGLAPKAHAQVIYTNPADATVSAPFNTIWFDVDGDGGGSPVRSSYFAGSDFAAYLISPSGTPYALANNSQRFVTQTSGFGATALRFAANDPINGSFTFNFSGYIHYGSNASDWDLGDTGYLGLRLNISGSNHYGWAQISYNGDGSLTLYDFAYEGTANTPILAGAIPEPATTAALAGLLAGSAALYRRRKLSAAA